MASGNGLSHMARTFFTLVLLAAALCVSGCDEDFGPDADPAPWSASADMSPPRPGQ